MSNETVAQTPNTNAENVLLVQEILLDQIKPNPNQPRKAFDQESLEGLASSIRKNGVIQPIIVTEKDADGRHVIIAGERRWRASELAKTKTIPCIVRNVKPEEIYDLSATENLTREDMTPYEEAMVYKVKKDQGKSDQEISTLFGKHRTHITNMLGLLELPKEIVDELAKKDSKLSMGHARALKGIKEHPEALLALFQRIITEGVSVRFVEEQVKEVKNKIAAGVSETEAATAATNAPKTPAPKADAPATGGTPTPAGDAGENTHNVPPPEAAPVPEAQMPTILLEAQKAMRNALRTDVKIQPTTTGEFKIMVQAFGYPDLFRLMKAFGVSDEGLLAEVKNHV